jgi:hypothetical protein
MNRFLAPILIALTFSVMFPSTSFADWKKVSENMRGMTFYVDFERIRKHGGFVYFWYLTDYLEPTKYGNLSYKFYGKGDCKLSRVMVLRFSAHKEPMGGGTPSVTNDPKNPEWVYPPPKSSIETELQLVCAYSK